MAPAAVLASVACGSTARTPADPPVAARDPAVPVPVPVPVAAGSPAAPVPGEPWWCVAFGNGEVGRCLATRMACAATRTVLLASQTRPDERISECAPQQDAVCFDTQQVHGGGADTLCHPTFAICRADLDHVRSGGAGDLRATSECQTRSQSVAIDAQPAGNDAAHW